MRRGRPLLLLASVAVLATSCASEGSDGEGPTAPTPSGASSITTSPSGFAGPTGAAVPDACTLVSAEDASIALGADVEVVEDPFGRGLLSGNAADFASVCAYRPVGMDDERGIGVGIAVPDTITEEEFDELTQGGIALGGPGDEGYAVDDGVIFRSGDLVVAVVVHTGEGFAVDRALALELAGIAAAGLPQPTPDPSNPACALLTEELAEGVLGIDLVHVSDAIVDDQRSGCGYREANGPTIVSLLITRGADAATDFEGALELASDEAGFRELEDLGDRAFVRVNEGQVDIVVLAGDTFLGTMTFSPDADLVDPTIELATAIVASL